MFNLSNLVSGILLLLLSVALYAYTMVVEFPSGLPASPVQWPRIVIIVLGVCALLLVATSLKGLRHLHRGAGALQLTNSLRSIQWSKAVTQAAPFLLVVLYVYFLGVLGYFLATLAVCVLLMLSLGERRLKYLAAVPLVFVGLIWVFFTQMTLVPLPMGEGPFRVLSQMVTYI